MANTATDLFESLVMKFSAYTGQYILHMKNSNFKEKTIYKHFNAERFLFEQLL